MPASADIYGLLGRGVQQPQDPLNTLAKTLQIQEMQQAGQDRALKQDEYQRGVEQKNKLMQLLGGEYADDETRASALLRGGFMKESQDYLKGRSDLRKTNADVAKTGVETDAKRLEVASKKLDIAGQAMGYVKDNPSVESANAAIQHLVSNGIWDQTQAEQAMARVMADQSPEGIRKLATMAYQSALSAKDQLPNFVQQNLGATSRVSAIYPVTLKQSTISDTPILQSADNAATQATSIENNKRSVGASMANAAATRDVAAATREANANTYDADRGVLVNRATGLARPAATMDGKPLGAKDKPLPEGAQKQIIGTRNLQDAVDGYQEALSKWGKTKMISPDARAEMGNAYNNMMLQAKEAYNLGVLNGPDYDILQSVVKDPTKWTSAITSNDAMSNQATKLKEIAANIERTAMEAHGKNYTPRKPKSGSTSGLPPDVAAALARHGG